MAHGLGAVKEMRLDAYAERFTEQGYRVLVFDYRHFGESEGSPRELIDIERQLDDWAAALHYVRALPTVDKRSIVLWGTSFSGGHVIEVARRDPEVAAVISQCPFTDGLASARTLRPVSLLEVSVLAVRDSVAPSRTPLRHVRKARLGQIRRYDVGHFDLYVGDAFEQVVADQIRFLREIVPVETVSG